MDRVGFKITSFTEKEVIEEFDSCLHLMDYLSRTGLSFAGKNGRDTVLRDLFVATSVLYDSMYGRLYEPTESELSITVIIVEKIPKEVLEKVKGKRVVPATFHLIQYLGWKEDASQPKPKSRGSGDLGSFIDELIKEDPDAKDRIRYGVLGEEGTNKLQTEEEYKLKVKYGHTAVIESQDRNPEEEFSKGNK